MNVVQHIEGRAYPLGLANIDTDTIIPGQYLKTITRIGLGAGAFQTLRSQPGNVFENPLYAGACILIAGDNFGCGSSREHAAWALLDLGVRAVIAPSFSDIFTGNAFKNGIVTVALPREAVDRLLDAARAGTPTGIDLATQTVTSGGNSFAFEIDPFHKHCLMNGLDEIGLTLARDASITNYEEQLSVERPWV
ncbi:3-isopropylmalate dehydratase small subunit [Pseudomonas fluorescens]|nr:3-isopropylmalate dehydratase small subunit [Pseudomonas fluorescens]